MTPICFHRKHTRTLKHTHSHSLSLLLKDSLFCLQVSLIQKARPELSSAAVVISRACVGRWRGLTNTIPCPPPPLSVSEANLHRDGNVAAMLDRRAAARNSAMKEKAASALSAEQLRLFPGIHGIKSACSCFTEQQRGKQTEK